MSSFLRHRARFPRGQALLILEISLILIFFWRGIGATSYFADGLDLKNVIAFHNTVAFLVLFLRFNALTSDLNLKHGLEILGMMRKLPHSL